LILRKNSKFDASRFQILRLKCTEFDFRWGSAADPVGELTALPQTLLAVFKGAYFSGEERGRGRKREGRGRGGKGKKRGGEGRRGEGASPQISWPRTAPG